VAGFDETGLRVAGRLHLVHCARTGKYTLIICHSKRGREGIDDAGVLDRFRGVAVHDAWAPYDTYVDAEHQLCCAHALRELAGVADTAPEDQWCWATQAADALVAIQKPVTEATAAAGALDPEVLDEQIRRYHSATQIGITSTTARTDQVMRKHNARPPTARPARRLPPLYPRLANTPRQQRLRTRHPHDQTQTENLRMPADPHRSHTVSARSAATSPPPPNTASTSSKSSSCSPKADPGCPHISNHTAVT
jgi:hypothetical protein